MADYLEITEDDNAPYRIHVLWSKQFSKYKLVLKDIFKKT